MAQAIKPDVNFHLYLLVGQSNMAGRGKVDAQSKQINPRIFMMDSSHQWIPATDPVHFDKPKIIGVGPALAFAEDMLPSDTTIKIGLVPCAWGGSPIRVWEPGTTYLNAKPYDFAIVRAQLAMKAGVLKGVIWHQGESDNDSARSLVYIQKFKSFVERVRTDLDMPDLPFVAGELGYFLKQSWLNPVLQEIPQKIANASLVSAKDLDHLGDTLHFNTPSARLLGQRYAIAMKDLQQASKH